MQTDVIIIGAGPAGLTAALYLARYEKKVLVLSEDIGGQASTSGEVGNYPGFELISGHELSEKILSQLKKYKNLEIKYPVKVESVLKKEGGFEVKAEEDSYTSKMVLITSGKRHRELGLPKEKELVGKGLSYCATFAKGKKTVVIGGGNSAADAAIILGRIAEEVSVLNLNERMQAETVRLEKIEGMGNIKIINKAKTTDIDTDNSMVSGIIYEDVSGKQNKIEAQMIFVEIGYVPNTEIFKDLTELNRSGEIVVDGLNETKTKGLYAAGDITAVPHKQIIIACGEGAKAAMSINLALEK
jgi:alkyl hydroperoxide reductase subunit F